MALINVSIAVLCCLAVVVQGAAGQWPLALAYAGFGIGYTGLALL